MPEIKITYLPLWIGICRCELHRPFEGPLRFDRTVRLLVSPSEFDPPTDVPRRELNCIFEVSDRCFDALCRKILLQFRSQQPPRKRVARSKVDSRIRYVKRVFLRRQRKFTQHVSELPLNTEPRQ